MPLTPKAFDILLVLVENGTNLTTKEELMRRVWPDSFVEEANLTVNIATLRRQLGESPAGQQYIETVPRKGYRFAIPVVRSTPQAATAPGPSEPARPAAASLGSASIESLPSPSPAVPEPSPDPAESHQMDPSRRRPRRALLWIAITAFAVVLSLLVSLAFRSWLDRHPAASAAPPRLPRSLAVLPFQNLRPNPDSDFIGFSLADAIINKLGYVSELTIRPSYAVQRYRLPESDIARTGEDLKVDTLLTGTYLHDGDDLRISCQLIDVKTQNLLWKGTFDLKYDKLLTVQDQVAHQVIRGLEVTLPAPEARRLSADDSVSADAYEYYLRGVDLYAKGDYGMAVHMLEKATELAPHFALAWAHLGRAYTANASFQFGGAEHYRRAEAAFTKALALSPYQIDARIYYANMLTDTGRVEEAVPMLREALKTNANHAETHWELGYAYRFGGMLQESVSECERARELDPGVKLNSSALNAYLYLGQYDRFLHSLPTIDDAPLIVFYRGLAEYYRGNLPAAQELFDRAYVIDPSILQAEIGKAFSFGIQHRRAEAIGLLRTSEEKIGARGVMDPEAIYKIAQAYAVLGDTSSALRVLERSIENGFFPYPYFGTDPLLDSLRSHPRFIHLVEKARKRYIAFASR